MRELHSWTLEPREAIDIQNRLRAQLVLQWDGRPIHTVAGVDMSLKDPANPALPPAQPADSPNDLTTGARPDSMDEANGESSGIAHAAIAVFSFPDLVPIEGVTANAPLNFPYVPGLLAFREGPAVLAAWEQLQHKPDLLMFDGQGIAHPRGMGIASLMGLWLERPTIGVAKSRLFGHHVEPGRSGGDSVDLKDERDPKRIIGAVLRTQPKSTPLYISPGHLINVKQAVDFVMRSVTKYRLPETTRWAHKLAAGTSLPIPSEPDEDNQLSLF